MKAALLAASIALTGPAAAAPGFNAPAYLDRAIAIVREKALTAPQINWAALSARVHREGDGATEPTGTYPALVTLLDGLGDGHSFLQLSPDRMEAYARAQGKPFVYPARKTSRPVDRSFFGRRDPVATDHIVAGRRVRSLVVPAFSGGRAAIAAYAGTLHRQASRAPLPCGYVIDLRGNYGGNMWPMVAGLSAVLGEGELGGSRGPGGSERWLLERGGASLREEGGNRVLAASAAGWQPLPSAARAPAAVLIDGGTGSSGEIVAVAFSGRAQTRRFGQPTVGSSTATEGSLLADGANLVIATSVVEDRTGRRFPAGLQPDTATPRGPATEAAALRWVAARCTAPRLIR